MSAPESGWQAGAAIAPFPIAEGTPLTGYLAREGPATGMLDPVTISTLILERDGNRLVIVAADLAAVDAALVGEVAAAAGIEPSQLALCASHTHSGPAGVVKRLHPASPNELDPALRARFVTTAAETIATARRDLQPVDLVFGATTIEGVAANRNDPAIPSDDQLSVLATRRLDGSIHCALVHFACHPTILGAASRVVSADFPGAIRRQLGHLLTSGNAVPTVLFVNGAAGDISTRFTRRAQDGAEVERLGGLLAGAAREALCGAHALTGPLQRGSTSVALIPRMSPSLPDQATPESSVEEGAPRAPSPGQTRILETRAQGATMLAALAALPEGALATTCDLDAWTLGELALLGVPAELFSSFGQQITASSTEPALVLGYTNGYIGYLADHLAHEMETYEALASPYGPEDGERMSNAAVELVSRLRQDRKPGDQAR